MNRPLYSMDASPFWTEVAYENATQAEMLERHFGTFRIPRDRMFLTAAMQILSDEMGFALSARLDRGVWSNGEPVPQMSYSFIEYVMGLDLSSTDVLEIGGGQSTSFWAKRARSVHTVDDDLSWVDDSELPRRSNVKLTRTTPAGYPLVLSSLASNYGLIALDCGANRFECADAAVRKLAEDGVFVLDNSDWYPNTAALLREHDLIQVDFADFRPAHHYRCTTSIFLRPSFRPRPSGSRLPLPPRGGKDVAQTNRWDQPGSR